MRKSLLSRIGCIALTVSVLASCGNSTSNSNSDVDSLRTIIEQQKEQIAISQQFTDAICTSMDSIVNSNGIIFKSTEDAPLSKARVTENIKAVQSIIENQRNRIAQLEEQLNNTNQSWAQKMKGVLEQMNRQLEEKDAEIAKLQQMVNDGNVRIEDLMAQLEEQNQVINQYEKTTESQRQTIDAQTNTLNEAYYVIATKKELIAQGLLTGGGILSKKKLNMSDLSSAKFTKIDIREKNVFEIPGKSAKILTQAPTDSYTLSSNGKGTTLTITNAKKFWSMNKYLVIQY